MSLTCHETIELMNLYLDGRLSGGQYQELAKHLEGCEHCRKRMNYLRVISSEIRADRPAIPDDLHSKIMHHINHADDEVKIRRFQMKKLQKILAVCAAAFVLVIVTPVAFKSISGGQAVSGPSTADSGSWISRLFQNWDLGIFGSGTGGESQDDTEQDPGQSDGVTGGSSGNTAQDADGNSAPEHEKTEGTYTVSQLRTTERFANYIVATGDAAALQSHFGLESVMVYPEDGSIYVYMPNNASSLARVYTSIWDMGLTLHLNPKGLPDTDENAPEILFVIFPQ